MSTETRLRDAVQDSLKQLRDRHAAALDGLLNTFIEAAVAERDAEVAETRAQIETAAQQTLEESLARAKAQADTHFAEARTALVADAQQKLERAMAEADMTLAEALKASGEDAANARAEAKQARDGAAEAHAAAENARKDAAAARLDKDKAREEAAQGRFELAGVRDELTSVRDELATARDELTSSRAQAEEAARAITDARRSERESGLARTSRLLESIKALDGAHSLIEVFDVLTREAGREAARAAVLLVRGDQIFGWRFAGFDLAVPDPKNVQLTLNGSGVVVDAVRTGRARTVNSEATGLEFAPLPDGRAAVAVPLQVGGRIVAVLYADDAASSAGSPTAWPEVVEILVRHAARCLESITADHAGGRAADAPSSPARNVMGRMS